MTTRARNYDDVKRALRNLTDFEHATMSARTVHFAASGGRLPSEYRDALESALRDNPSVYVVYSYGTPIAWTTLGKMTGRYVTVIPPVKYSATTSKHQTYARNTLPGV